MTLAFYRPKIRGPSYCTYEKRHCNNNKIPKRLASGQACAVCWNRFHLSLLRYTPGASIANNATIDLLQWLAFMICHTIIILLCQSGHYIDLSHWPLYWFATSGHYICHTGHLHDFTATMATSMILLPQWPPNWSTTMAATDMTDYISILICHNGH